MSSKRSAPPATEVEKERLEVSPVAIGAAPSGPLQWSPGTSVEVGELNLAGPRVYLDNAGPSPRIKRSPSNRPVGQLDFVRVSSHRHAELIDHLDLDPRSLRPSRLLHYGFRGRLRRLGRRSRAVDHFDPGDEDGVATDDLPCQLSEHLMVCEPGDARGGVPIRKGDSQGHHVRGVTHESTQQLKCDRRVPDLHHGVGRAAFMRSHDLEAGGSAVKEPSQERQLPGSFRRLLLNVFDAKVRSPTTREPHWSLALTTKRPGSRGLARATHCRAWNLLRNARGSRFGLIRESLAPERDPPPTSDRESSRAPGQRKGPLRVVRGWPQA